MSIAYILILIRLLLAPTIVLFAMFYKDSGSVIVMLMTIGLLTDIFDGIVARHFNISSEKMRRMDSQTDLVFWLAVGYSSWHLFSDILQEYTFPIALMFFMELMCYVISIYKFKKETCTHAYLSKLFGIAMFVAFFNLFAFSKGGSTLTFAIIVGLISHLDRILITLILPKWAFDIPSFYHAYLARQGKEIKRYKIFN